jgi:hypothetical protein
MTNESFFAPPIAGLLALLFGTVLLFGGYASSFSCFPSGSSFSASASARRLFSRSSVTRSYRL